jgi:hypothetical protein
MSLVPAVLALLPRLLSFSIRCDFFFFWLHLLCCLCRAVFIELLSACYFCRACHAAIVTLVVLLPLTWSCLRRAAFIETLFTVLMSPFHVTLALLPRLLSSSIRCDVFVAFVIFRRAAFAMLIAAFVVLVLLSLCLPWLNLHSVLLLPTAFVLLVSLSYISRTALVVLLLLTLVAFVKLWGSQLNCASNWWAFAWNAVLKYTWFA